MRLSLGALRLGAETPLSGVAQIITATLTPAMSALYDGQAIDDVTSYATMVASGNFASSAGTISSAVVAFTGDAVDATTALAEDDTAGFTVTVTDSEGNERVFSAGIITVQYAANISVAAGLVTIDVNPLVPDTETISVALTGGVYDGETVTFTPADLAVADGRGFNLLEPVAALTTDGGTTDELDAGDALDLSRDGLWAYPSDQTAPTITAEAWDDAGALGALPFTADGGEDTAVFIRETDGLSVADSNTFDVAAVAPAGITEVAETVVIDVWSSASTWTSPGTLTAQSGSDRCMVFAVALSTKSTDIQNVTLSFGAEAATLRSGIYTTGSANIPDVAIFSILDTDIPTGPQSITVNTFASGGGPTDANGVSVVCYEFTGVNQATPFGAVTPAVVVTSGAISVTRNMADEGNMMFSAIIAQDQGRVITYSGSQSDPAAAVATRRIADGTTPLRPPHIFARQLAASAGNLTHTATPNANDVLIAAAVEIIKAV